MQESSNNLEHFARRADMRPRGPVGELFDFLMSKKKWWLMPIIIVLLLIGVLVVLGGTGIAPFIYTLF